MTQRGRHRLGGAVILIAGGLATWALCLLTFNPLFVTGGTAPAIISGPALGAGAVAGGAALLLAGAAWAAGRARWLLLMLWVLFLSTATHRLVEWADGAVTDQWLWMPLQRLPASADETRRCRVNAFSMRCRDGARQGFSTSSPFPLMQFHPGRWTSPD